MKTRPCFHWPCKEFHGIVVVLPHARRPGNKKKTCNLVTDMSTLGMRDSRPVSWIKAARRDFEEFPEEVRDRMLPTLAIAAEGGKADIAKPFKGVDGGVFEIAVRHRGDAFRILYAVKMGADIWVIHAFQKKSKSGIKTPLMEVDIIREHLKQLKEALS